MKDIINKLSEIENTPVRLSKATKKILKEEKKPQLKKITKNSSFKDVFENMSNMKPLPVVNQSGTNNQNTGLSAFLDIDDNSPSAKAIQSAVSDLAQQNKAQIVMPNTQANAPNNNSAQNTQAVNQNQQNQTQQPLKEVDGAKKVSSVYVSITDDECEAEYEFDDDGDIELTGIYDSNDRNIIDLLTFNELESVRQQVMDSIKNNKDEHSDYEYEQFKNRKHKTNEGIKEKIKGAVHRELKKDIPLVQTRRDYAWMQAGDAYSKGNKRKGDRYMTWQERGRKKYGDTTTNPEGTYRTKTSDFNESKKPDFLDSGKDGNKKESMRKAAADRKKQRVKESMKHKINAARLEGKTHGLRGHAYHGNTYEDIEERRAYHDGYKEGLDECYMNEDMASSVPTMSPMSMPSMTMEGEYSNVAAELESIGEQIVELAHEAMQIVSGTPEENAARSYWYPHILGAVSRDNGYGGGSMITLMDTVMALDAEGDEEMLDEYEGDMFESWGKQLKDLINEGKEDGKKPLTEGLSVSMNKGNGMGSDSVSITATDQDADELLALIKNSGLGLFGDEPVSEPSSAMSVQPEEFNTCMECGRVMEDGHSCGVKKMVGETDFFSLINKLNKLAEGEEFDSEGNRLASKESFDSFKERVASSDDPFEIVHDGLKGVYGDEVLEQLQQYEDEVIQDSEGMLHPDDDHEEIVDRIIEKMNEPEEDVDDEMGMDSDMDFGSEELHEWANKAGKRGTEHAFVQDIEFMTQTIAGGLNKPKSTGQTTVPVIASQTDRQDDSLGDITRLAGIKK